MGERGDSSTGEGNGKISAGERIVDREKTTVPPPVVVTEASPLVPLVSNFVGTPPSTGIRQSSFIPAPSASRTRVRLSGLHVSPSTERSQFDVQAARRPGGNGPEASAASDRFEARTTLGAERQPAAVREYFEATVGRRVVGELPAFARGDAHGPEIVIGLHASSWTGVGVAV